jgi:hypothetical protein
MKSRRKVVKILYNEWVWRVGSLFWVFISHVYTTWTQKNTQRKIRKLYVLSGPCIEPRWRRNFPTRPAMGHTQIPVQGIPAVFDIDIFVKCNWAFTRWQQYSTHLHTNNTQNDTKQKIHITTQQLWESAGRAPSWLVIPWHLPYIWGKSMENPQSG